MVDETLMTKVEKAHEDYGVEIYPSKRGLLRRKQWRARIISEDNLNRLFISSESYNNRQELIDLVERVFPHLPWVETIA
jgi:hypothetical protein